MNETYRKAEEIDKRYKDLNEKYVNWCLAKGFSLNAVNPFYEFDISSGIENFIRIAIVFAVVFGISLLFSMIPFLDFSTALAFVAFIYFGSLGAFTYYADKKEKFYHKKLEELSEEGRALYNEYRDRRFEENMISNGFIHFSNGMAVGPCGTTIYVNLEKDYGCFKIFNKGRFFEKEIQELMYNNFKLRNDKVLLNDSIASLEFNENFCVIADKGTERNGIAYFSPSVQLNLLRKKAFRDIIKIDSYDKSIFTVENDLLMAETVYHTNAPQACSYDALDSESHHCLEDIVKLVDAYCEEFSEIAYKIVTEFDEKANFLCGAARI